MHTKTDSTPNEAEASEQTETPDLFGEADLAARVSAAARIAEGAGEFKDKAFAMLLEHLLSTSGSGAIPAREIGGTHKARSSSARRARGGSRRSVVAKKVDEERLKPIQGMDPEVRGEWSEALDRAPGFLKPYGVLACAQEQGVDGLTVAEIRHISTNIFRVGIPQGTLTGSLSKAPATEIARTKGDDGSLVYTLLGRGQKAWKEKSVSTDAQSEEQRAEIIEANAA